MNSSKEESDNSSIETRITDRVEKSILQREDKRFRNLYIVIGFISFFGIGIISQIVNLYASIAVEKELKELKGDLETAKLYSQILSFSTILSASERVTNDDRNRLTQLITREETRSSIVGDPTFLSILKISLSSLAQKNSPTHVSKIFDTYEKLCLLNSEISTMLIQFYGYQVFSSNIQSSEIHKNNVSRLLALSESMRSNNAEGVSAAYEALLLFQISDRTRTQPITELILSASDFSDKNKNNFFIVLNKLTDLKSGNFSSGVIPTLKKTKSLALDFKNSYKEELLALNKELKVSS